MPLFVLIQNIYFFVDENIYFLVDEKTEMKWWQFVTWDFPACCEILEPLREETVIYPEDQFVSYTQACETSPGCLRSIYPSLGMRQLFGDVTMGQWLHY